MFLLEYRLDQSAHRFRIDLSDPREKLPAHILYDVDWHVSEHAVSFVLSLPRSCQINDRRLLFPDDVGRIATANLDFAVFHE